ncbi:MAG: LamG domain-containing protein [Phycisphaeraceae bacterium]|nr:LamG domain-containing protein [Phycisphaeraceae bacterium]
MKWTVLGWAILVVGWSGSATALDRESLRFYLTFDEGLAPRIAGTGTEPTFVKGGEADARRVEGCRGRGLNVTPELSLRYLTPQTFARQEGTIAFWIKPVGWGGVNCHRYFLIVRADQVALHFYIYYGNPWLYVRGPDGYQLIGGAWQAAFTGEPFPQGQWTFLACTYRPGQQCFYVNGILAGQNTDSLIEPRFDKQGIVEIPPGDQVLDEIMIFDRALTRTEIQAVYRANVPVSHERMSRPE